MNKDDHPRWDKLRAALREVGTTEPAPGEDLSAPIGFATRVVSRFRADERAHVAGIALWRRWTLTGAACALLLFGGGFLLDRPNPPAESLIPVPVMDAELQELIQR